MKSEDLSEAIGRIDDDIIEEAEKTREKNRKRIFWGITSSAAAVAVIGGLVLCLPLIRGRETTIALTDGQHGTTAAAGETVQETVPPTETAPTEEETPYTAYLAAKAVYPKRAAVDYGDEDYYDTPEYKTALKEMNEWRFLLKEYKGTFGDFFTKTSAELLSGEGENKVYSPLNLYMALSMLTELTEGESRSQITDLLGEDSAKSLRTKAAAVWNSNYVNNGLTKSLPANSFWLNDKIAYKQEALDTLAADYFASSFSGNPASDGYSQALRSWINEQTGGLLSERTKDIKMTPETVISLASTLYFQAQWNDKFDENRTKTDVFHAKDGDIECDFMCAGDEETFYYYFYGDNFKARSLSFESGGGSMWFFLPDEGVSPEELLGDESIEQIINYTCKSEGENLIYSYDKFTQAMGSLVVPKFDITEKSDLIEGLKNLGVTDIFSTETADFSPLTDLTKEVPVYLSKAEQAARVSIDEKGCTAASYVVMEADCGACIPPEVEHLDFILDRPFLFVITGNGDLPLFAGIVNQP